MCQDLSWMVMPASVVAGAVAVAIGTVAFRWGCRR